ncbi:hypothetical protein ACPPVW_11935 [Leifsonia sp. McL0607]|uniref:hypothetical protein n=1 Tax=Leifsonia sp. McL0607 TaxID=3415672 RepID=UPI003CE7437B
MDDREAFRPVLGEVTALAGEWLDGVPTAQFPGGSTSRGSWMRWVGASRSAARRRWRSSGG